MRRALALLLVTTACGGASFSEAPSQATDPPATDAAPTAAVMTTNAPVVDRDAMPSNVVVDAGAKRDAGDGRKDPPAPDAAPEAAPPDPPPACGPSTCAGCCDSSGLCQPIGDSTCALAGGTCTDCTQSNLTCNSAGQCEGAHTYCKVASDAGDDLYGCDPEVQCSANHACQCGPGIGYCVGMCSCTSATYGCNTKCTLGAACSISGLSGGTLVGSCVGGP